jgi:hypothetical protein
MGVGDYDVLNLERSLFLFLNKQKTLTALLTKNVREVCCSASVMRAKGSWAATLHHLGRRGSNQQSLQHLAPIHHDL